MICANCHTEFSGNYCPECGQSAKTCRFTVKNALLSTLEVWGMGNRSLPRTLFCLFTRPGQMIGDYLDGHRVPYFPPVKMLFVLCIFFAVVSSWRGGGETVAGGKADVGEVDVGEVDVEDVIAGELERDSTHSSGEYREVMSRPLFSVGSWHPTIRDLKHELESFYRWMEAHKAVELLSLHSFFMLMVWWLFRKSPVRPRSTLAENFYIQVYISGQLMALSVLWMLFFGNDRAGDIFYPLPPLLLLAVLVWDFRYLFGYGWRRTLWLTLLVHLMLLLLSITVVVVFVLSVAAMAGLLS
ncbi:MAG: DUF3667 domain-containing protein [Prevotella sp.]